MRVYTKLTQRVLDSKIMMSNCLDVRVINNHLQLCVNCTKGKPIVSLNTYALRCQEISKRHTLTMHLKRAPCLSTLHQLVSEAKLPGKTRDRVLGYIAMRTIQEIMASIEIHSNPAHVWADTDIFNSKELCQCMTECKTQNLCELLDTRLACRQENIPLIDGCINSHTAANAIAKDLKHCIKNRIFAATSTAQTALAILQQLNLIYSKNINANIFGFSLDIVNTCAQTNYCGIPASCLQHSSKCISKALLDEQATATCRRFQHSGVWNADAEIGQICQLPSLCKNSKAKIMYNLQQVPKCEKEYEDAKLCVDYLWKGVVVMPELLSP